MIATDFHCFFLSPTLLFATHLLLNDPGFLGASGPAAAAGNNILLAAQSGAGMSPFSSDSLAAN